MEFFIRNPGTVVDYYGLRDAFPNIFIPANPSIDYLEDMGVDLVNETIPATPINSDAVRNGVEEVDGKWQYAWLYIPWTAERIEAERIAALPTATDYEEVWQQIKIERDRREQDSGVFVDDAWFHSDTVSQIKYLGLKDQARDMILAGSPMTEIMQQLGMQIQWRTMGGTYKLMTIQLACNLVAAVSALQAKVHYCGTVHRQTMLASTAPKEYNFSTGWPDYYEE